LTNLETVILSGFDPCIIHGSRTLVVDATRSRSTSSEAFARENPMGSDPAVTTPLRCSIAPWLSVRNSARAVEFYKSAFGATEVFRLEAPDGDVVARLSIQGAEFWLSGESPAHGNFSPESLGGGSVRMILTVPDPDAVFNQALKAGASEVFPVGDEHGWRLGRVVDPFGHHWEIGRPLVTQ
jgi:PhnB protein